MQQIHPTDACTGDGGSPLVCPIAGKWYVVGLVAWGVGEFGTLHNFDRKVIKFHFLRLRNNQHSGRLHQRYKLHQLDTVDDQHLLTKFRFLHKHLPDSLPARTFSMKVKQVRNKACGRLLTFNVSGTMSKLLIKRLPTLHSYPFSFENLFQPTFQVQNEGNFSILCVFLLRPWIRRSTNGTDSKR